MTRPGLLRRMRWWLVAAAVLVGVRAAAPWYVRTHVLPTLGEAQGLEISAADVSLDLLAGGVVVEGLVVVEHGREPLTAPRVEANLGLGSLVGGRIVVERLVVDRPVLRVRLEERGSTDIDRVAREALASRPGDAPAVVLEDVRVEGATVHYEDAVTDPAAPLRLTFSGIRATAHGLEVAGVPSGTRRGDVEADGSVEQSDGAAPFTVLAWVIPGRPEQEVVAHAAITGFRLGTVPQYVSATERRLLGADELDVVVTTEVRGAEIVRGAAVAQVPGRDRPLIARFSGPVSDPSVDPTGSLTALFELPFAHLGAPGSAVWGAASSVVGGAVDCVEDLARLDVAGAGKSVVGGVARGAESVGRGLLGALGSLGRALGIGDDERSAPQRDLAAVHAAVRASLVAQRDAAERAGEDR